MTIRLTTHSMYRTYMLEFINPELGHVGLRKLTTEMFQKLYQKWEKEEMSPNTIRLIHTIVKKALKDAVMWKKLAYNPLEYVKLPKKRKTIVHVFSDEEIERLLQSAKQMRMYLLFRMALLLGVRLGELSGLQWSDIDFVKGVLSIKRTVSYVRHPVTHAFGFYVGEPKTDTSERAIFLPHEILASLQVHREEQMKLIGTTSNWRDLNLVFCVGNGNYVNPNYVRVLFDRLLQKAGLEHMKFHGLRHNASLILRKLGIDPVVRKEMLGHSSLFMTDDVYGHSTEKMHKDAAAEISRLFGED